MKKSYVISFLALIMGCIIGFYLANSTLSASIDASSSTTPTEATVPSAPSLKPKLAISCKIDRNGGTTTITTDELGGHAEHDLSYTSLKDVTISINGTP